MDPFQFSERIKILREGVDFDIASQRHEFLRRLCPLIDNYGYFVLNVREIFRKEEIEHLILDSMHLFERLHGSRRNPFIDFLIISQYRDEPELDEDGQPVLLHTTPLHRAARLTGADFESWSESIFVRHSLIGHLVIPYSNHVNVKRFKRQFRASISYLFDRVYNRYDANYIDELGWTHFHVACGLGLDDVVEKFLEAGQDPDCRASGSKVDPPLHLAVDDRNIHLAKMLLSHGADPNSTDSAGFTPLLRICSEDSSRSGNDIDLVKMLLELDSDEYPAARLDAQDSMGRTSLHWTVAHGKTRLTDMLLRAGASTTLPDNNGLVPLHVDCETYSSDTDLLRMLLELPKDECLAKQLEARDNRGNTPLLLALKNRNNKKEVLELLLTRGADPNSASSNDGSTPLQVICEISADDGLLERFFEICDEIHKTVLIDAFNDRGETPLNPALLNHNEKNAELLLRRGANVNLVNSEGSTLLHAICNKDRDDKSAKILFKICHDIHRTVQVNAEDNDGNTPLQLAVANLLPNTVDVLLNHGADLSKCRFPTIIDPKWSYGSENGLLRVASGALAVAEHLETRGYDFSRSDALTIMKFFAKHDLFEKSSDLIKCWCYNKTFAKEAKRTMINSNLSLYDLVQLRPEEEEKLLTYMDYFTFAGHGMRPFTSVHYKICFLHMYEKLSRGFFRRWALGPFRELIHERLPLECCDMVLENLNNRDLGNICLAVAGQTS
uniref:Uncharacterized protein n=1 Tax=Trichogramma kaykai TaxID=54128 RepID=A0ABD2XJM7_9HYME